MTKLRVLDLFSGIGGFSLGMERTGGFETTALCERAEFPRAVLEKHWPDVPCAGDVTTMEFPDADVITAGFPCQDISWAGFGAGLSGERSGLFWEVVRAVRMVGPRYVLLENVAALFHRGMDTVCGAMAAEGYDAEWDCISAADVGAPHLRPRAWIVAYANREQGRTGEVEIFAHVQNWLETGNGLGWDAEPGICRVDDGVPGALDRNSALGNAVVPRIPEMIGRAILAVETA